MKIVDLTSDQVKVYQSQGWIYVPSGAAWGLSDVPYLAQNVDFSCSGSSSSSSSGGDGKTDGKEPTMYMVKSDGRGSIVQAAHGTNLASTGNMLFIVEIFSVRRILTATGLFLRLRTRLFLGSLQVSLLLMRNLIPNLILLIGLGLLLFSAYLVFLRHSPYLLSFEKAPTTVNVLSYESPQSIEIPSIAVNLPIVPAIMKGNSWETSNIGVSYLSSSPLPGQREIV